jgi:dipeptidyl aminopeptidase/acylaminoacyl peptidase
MDLFTPPGGSDVRDRFGSRILKAGADEKTKLVTYREVSPVNYLRPNSPPLLMMQGDQDPTIPVQHAHYMKERADAVKAPVETFIVQNSGHNWREVGGMLRPNLDEIMIKTAAFMKSHLERVSPSPSR